MATTGSSPVSSVPFTEDSERVRRFTQEAKAASALNHPNIISVYDIGECETGRYIVMEFVDGQNVAFSNRERQLTRNLIHSRCSDG